MAGVLPLSASIEVLPLYQRSTSLNWRRERDSNPIAGLIRRNLLTLGCEESARSARIPCSSRKSHVSFKGLLPHPVVEP